MAELAKRSSNIVELLYSLQVVESFVNQYQLSQEQNVIAYYSEMPGQGDAYPALDEAY